MTSITTPSQQMESDWSLQKIWNRLVEPSSAITNVAERRQARLLTTMLLVYMTLGTVTLLLLPILNPTSGLQVGSLIGVFLVAIPYAISRTRSYKIAAYILMALVALVSTIPLFTSTNSANSNRVIILAFLVIPILLASMLLTKRGMFVVIAAVIAFVLIAPHLDPTLGVVSAPLVLLIAASVLLYVFVNHRDGLEKDRQAELAEALKRAESANAAMIKTNAEIAQKNQELMRANALIRETTRLKSEFMATMSHELRTPLNAIRGFTSIMLEGMGGEVDDEAVHMLSRINSNGERLLNLINDVLDIAKIEAGRLELVNEPLQPRQMVEQWRAQMSVLAEQKGVDFEVHVDPALPETLYGDGQRITQIAVNLLGNAFKFTTQGTVKLDVQQQADKWTIRVSDTGIGIPPHALNYIFEEFRQVDGSSKRQYGGTGLGLAIVRNLCRTMDGNILVSSELGKGSVFTVILPLRTELASELAQAS
ncbi:MAG: ATP-binding protein [Anaerolineae bacterium]